MTSQLNKFALINQIDNAKKHLEARKNKKAFKILNKIIKDNPSNYDIWVYLGIAKRRLGDLDGAIECFKNASELNISMLEAWGLLTTTLIDKGNINMAKEMIEKACRINPYDTKINFFHKNLIRIYKKFGPFF